MKRIFLKCYTKKRHFNLAHHIRNKRDVYDTTGNILVNYTLFGFENQLTIV
ncbi:MAG: hypothetical protein LBK58_13600 [Prevotellaceae bacterium]|nr:hypothetical protein [Prevotellaceae bacterium]